METEMTRPVAGSVLRFLQPARLFGRWPSGATVLLTDCPSVILMRRLTLWVQTTPEVHWRLSVVNFVGGPNRPKYTLPNSGPRSTKHSCGKR